jgi:hypothetical protein
MGPWSVGWLESSEVYLVPTRRIGGRARECQPSFGFENLRASVIERAGKGGDHELGKCWFYRVMSSCSLESSRNIPSWSPLRESVCLSTLRLCLDRSTTRVEQTCAHVANFKRTRFALTFLTIFEQPKGNRIEGPSQLIR